MNNIYFMCENCGIETNGITFVNGMKFCAKCYHQIFGKDNQQTEITQLKQQLAEKDKEIETLKQELAELKEKAIVPKFKGSSIVYSIAFKEIEKVQVIAYLNKCIILCRNLKTRELHTIHCDYLFETEQEAQAKLKEIQSNG